MTTNTTPAAAVDGELVTTAHAVPLEPSRHYKRLLAGLTQFPSDFDLDSWKSPSLLHIANIRGGAYFHLHYTGPAGQTRTEFDGPLIPGPRAYANPMVTAIAADPRMSSGYEQRKAELEERVVHARIGDTLVFPGGVAFHIVRANNDNVSLQLPHQCGWSGRWYWPLKGLEPGALVELTCECGTVLPSVKVGDRGMAGMPIHQKLVP